MNLTLEHERVYLLTYVFIIHVTFMTDLRLNSLNIHRFQKSYIHQQIQKCLLSRLVLLPRTSFIGIVLLPFILNHLLREASDNAQVIVEFITETRNLSGIEGKIRNLLIVNASNKPQNFIPEKWVHVELEDEFVQSFHRIHICMIMIALRVNCCTHGSLCKE